VRQLAALDRFCSHSIGLDLAESQVNELRPAALRILRDAVAAAERTRLDSTGERNHRSERKEREVFEVGHESLLILPAG
jgi:hypothetical protein